MNESREPVGEVVCGKSSRRFFLVLPLTIGLASFGWGAIAVAYARHHSEWEQSEALRYSGAVFPVLLPACSSLLIALCLAVFATWTPIAWTGRSSVAAIRGGLIWLGLFGVAAMTCLFVARSIDEPSVALLFLGGPIAFSIGALRGGQIWRRSPPPPVPAESADESDSEPWREGSPWVVPPGDRYPMWGVLIIPACLGLIPMCIFFSGAFWQTLYGAYDHVAWRHGDPRAMPDRSPLLGLIAAAILGLFLWWGSPRTSRRGLVAVLRGALAGAGVYGFLNVALFCISPLWGMVDYSRAAPTLFWVVLAMGPVFTLVGGELGRRAWKAQRATDS